MVSRVHFAVMSVDFSAASRATRVIFSPSAACDLIASCIAPLSKGKTFIMSCIIFVTSAGLFMAVSPEGGTRPLDS